VKTRSTFIILFLAASGCGSPLLDHKTSSKPQAFKRSSSSQDTSVTRAKPQSSECEHAIEDTPLCASLLFSERPSYQASLKSFQAELRIWDTRNPQDPVTLKTSPLAYHRCETECCPPPQIEVKALGPGRFRLSNIEFHALGWFDFLIEIHSPEYGLRRIQIPIEVFDE